VERVPKLIGRYRIDGELGRGGMGVVYRGWDPDLQRAVAIKMIGDEGRGRGSRPRLVREARAMAKLSHPNVLTVYEVGSEQGGEFIVMELVEGTNLAEWLRAGHTRREILRAFLDAGRGLAAAHAAGMIHRDFKPHNVLIRRDGRVLVTDFGLVRIDSGELSSPPPSDAAVAALVGLVAEGGDPASAPTVEVTPADPELTDTAHSPTAVDATSDALTRTGAVLGTPGYMAPEQLRGRADARSDQFAFCVALWQALSGELPFPTTSAELTAAIERGPGGTLRGRERAILARGLAADPRARWPSMDALLHALSGRGARVGWIVGLAGLALVAGGAATVHALAGAPPPAAPPPVPPDPLAAMHQLLAGTVRHVTMEDGCDEFPSLSPDGRTVVYDTLVGSDYEVTALELDTGHRRHITDDPGWSYKAAVSPDGQQVAFLRGGAKGGSSTYVVPFAGGTPRAVGVGGLQPVWTADGRALWIGNGATAQLVSLDGNVLRTVTAPAEVRPQVGAVLPDGRLAAVMFPVQGDQTATGVGVFDTDGTWRWLLQAPLLESIAVAPGGTSLLVAHVTDAGTRELWSVPLAGGKADALAGPAQPTSGIAIARGGGRMLWSDCEPKGSLAILAGNPLALAPLPTGDWTDQAPAAIPGGRHVVVASDRDRTLRTWVVDLDRRDSPRELPAGEHDPSALAVSSDGKTAYSVEDDGALYAQPLDGSAPPHRLVANAVGTPAPRLDGSVAIAVGDPLHTSIVIVPASGGEPRTLVAAGALPAAAPASDDLYFVALAGAERGTIAHRDSHGQTAPVARGLGARQWRELAVSPDGAQLALLEDTAITIVDLAHHRVAATYSSGSDMFTGLTWVGRTLLVSRVQFEGDLWMVERK
jgi:predicted Ser/Thr protein kinase